MAWRVARSLDVLLAQINTAAPNRSKVSDGSIGDAAHATRDSDHNPWVKDSNGVGVVRARDFTHDPAGGFDSYAFAVRLAAYAVARRGLRVGHPALKSGAYIISNGRIWSWDRRAEGWRPYTGSNPHDHHVHVSVALAQRGYDSVLPWRLFGPSPAELARRAKALAVVKAARAELTQARLALGAAKGKVTRALGALRRERQD